MWRAVSFFILLAMMLAPSWGPALSQVSSPSNVAASKPLNTATNSVGEVRINEVMFYPDTGSYEWVELKNNGSAPVNISGYGITDEDGNWYRIPDALPDVPAGAFVVVIFDGLGSGSDDYNFSDNVATLHSPPGLVNIFEDDADQCALYSVSHFLYLPLVLRNYTGPTPPEPAPSTGVFVPPIVSFVAWGGPSEGDDNTAVTAGLWPDEAYIGSTEVPGNEAVLAGGSVGLYPGQLTGSPSDWAIYLPGQTSQGMENPPPGPYFRNPPDGITTSDHQIPFGWSNVAGAESYHLEVDDDPAFGSPELAVDVADSEYVPTTPFPDGTFYFRVKALYAGGESSYSSTGQVTFITVSETEMAGAEMVAQGLLGVTPKLQHKDTRMLCLDGHNETGQHRWDSAHEDDGDWTVGNGTPVRGEPHDDKYCTRASISMIVAYHGGNLSQDRISYYAYGGGAAEGDLGCGRGLWPNQHSTWGTGKNVFDWAMNGNAVTSSRGKPTFTQVKGWIDAGRPLLIVENNDRHSVVLDGYLDLVLWKLAHRVDPWTASGSWVSWDTWNVSEYHVPPAGVTPRSDEASVSADSDGDGIVDFDEINRFKGNLRNLNPNDPDSDGDLVPDKLDMREYLFDSAGNYSRRTPDIDGDGDRKETDPDNDNFWDVGSIDGCEDSNQNGKFEPDLEETSNFDPAEGNEKECPAPVVEITSPESGSSDDDCVITLEGTINSETDLTSASVLVTSGPQSNRFDLAWSGSAPDYSFSQEIPLFSGDNLVKVDAVNQFGSGSDHIYVECTMVVRDIHIQLYWPLLGADVDLHFIRPGGTYWSIPDDCHWRNMNPDWGVPGDPTDDPELDIDCITSCTLENIVLSRPVTGTYSVEVHYYWDHDLGPTTASVRVWVQGVRHDFAASLVDDQVWSVCTIEWPSKVVTSGG